MSIRSKKAAAAKRKQLKARAKAAKKALYAGYAAAGKDNSKRQMARAKKTRVSPVKHMHIIANCGNLGCKACFSIGV